METLTPEAHHTTIAAQLEAERAGLGTVIHAETVVDQEKFERLRFSVGDDVSFTFRGREEIPEIAKASNSIQAVLSTDERPLHTSGDKYGEWLSSTTQGDPYADPFERAHEVGATTVEFVASETPLGVVDAALQLVEIGLGDETRKHELQVLREKIQNRTFDGEVAGVLDALYASGTVDTKTGSRLGYDFGGLHGGDVSADGPMLVALWLAGEPHAAKILELKHGIVDIMDNTEVVVQNHEASFQYRERPLKQPGDILSSDELEALKQAHLVAIHTSEIEPFLVDHKTGTRLIRPTSEFGAKQHGQYPRSSLHFSLNHAVESHLFGNFEKRPYTIVTPLESLAELNGSPAVLRGVDTYFTLDPGMGLLIPSKSTIIETSDKITDQLIEKTGNVLRVNTGNLNPDSLKSLVDYVADHLDTSNYYGVDIRRLAVVDTAYKLIETGVFSTALPSLTRDFERLEEQEPKVRAFLEQYKPIYELIAPYLDEHPDWDTRRVLREAFISLLEGDAQINNFEAAAPLFVEAIRRMLVNEAIEGYDGQIVHSDGMSVYIQEEEFQKAEHKARDKISLRGGLHQDEPEGRLEYVYGTALHRAIEFIEIPKDIADANPNIGRNARADFHWERFDSRDIWTSLSRAPWATRRLAASMGMLTFSKKLHEPSNDLF